MVYYCVIESKSGFIGMAKLEPFTSKRPDPHTEPGQIWTRSGKTAPEAYWNITDRMIELGLETSVVFCSGG